MFLFAQFAFLLSLFYHDAFTHHALTYWTPLSFDEGLIHSERSISGDSSSVFMAGHKQVISRISKGNQNIVVHVSHIYEQHFMSSDVSHALYCIKVQNILYCIVLYCIVLYCIVSIPLYSASCSAQQSERETQREEW